jgi:hypothetical protein
MARAMVFLELLNVTDHQITLIKALFLQVVHSLIVFAQSLMDIHGTIYYLLLLL